ncbi:2-methoxy-6-polyprenyl-1,4-benzoquinol methylase [subsurface metagenome]
MEAILKNNRGVWNRLHREGYNGYRKPHHFDQRLNFLTRNLPLRCLDKTKMLLEIGCGVGHWMEEFSSKVRAVHGVDISEEAVRLGRARLQHLTNVFFFVTKGNELNRFDLKMFDLVYSFGCFQHIPRQATADYLKEAYRVLKLGGYLVFQVIYMFDPKRNQQDIGLIKGETTRGYTRQQIEHMVRAANLSLQSITRQNLTIKAKNRAAWLWTVCKKGC